MQHVRMVDIGGMDGIFFSLHDTLRRFSLRDHFESSCGFQSKIHFQVAQQKQELQVEARSKIDAPTLGQTSKRI